MGQYLHIGIGYSMRVAKQGKWKKYSKEDILAELGKKST